MDVVSVDLGYGFTKGMTVSNRVLFPSVVSMGFERRLQGRYLEGGSSAKYEVVCDGQRYFVGDLALQQVRHRRERLRKTGSITLRPKCCSAPQ